MSDIPDSLDKRVALRLHEKGVEMTPTEVRETRDRAFARIRKFMADRGHTTPVSDSELLFQIKQANQLGGNGP